VEMTSLPSRSSLDNTIPYDGGHTQRKGQAKYSSTDTHPSSRNSMKSLFEESIHPSTLRICGAELLRLADPMADNTPVTEVTKYIIYRGWPYVTLYDRINTATLPFPTHSFRVGKLFFDLHRPCREENLTVGNIDETRSHEYCVIGFRVYKLITSPDILPPSKALKEMAPPFRVFKDAPWTTSRDNTRYHLRGAACYNITDYAATRDQIKQGIFPKGYGPSEDYNTFRSVVHPSIGPTYNLLHLPADDAPSFPTTNTSPPNDPEEGGELPVVRYGPYSEYHGLRAWAYSREQLLRAENEFLRDKCQSLHRMYTNLLQENTRMTQAAVPREGLVGAPSSQNLIVTRVHALKLLDSALHEIADALFANGVPPVVAPNPPASTTSAPECPNIPSTVEPSPTASPDLPPLPIDQTALLPPTKKRTRSSPPPTHDVEQDDAHPLPPANPSARSRPRRTTRRS
jgi:hypothetical protein